MIILLTAAIILSGILHIRAEYGRNLPQIFLFKPLTTSLIILLCLLTPAGGVMMYKYYILIGLCFSLVGDIFLMLPSDKFLQGLLSFLTAHVFYILAFSYEYGFQMHLKYFIPLLLFIFVLWRMLLPHAGTMKIPVMFYTILIISMLWQALERWGISPSQSAMLAAIGALCFVFSDTSLAYNRFVRPFKSRHLFVLVSYYFAQWAIALSV